MSAMDESKLLEERDRIEAWLSKQPGFNGVGIKGTGGNQLLMVYTNRMPAEVKERVAKRLQGVPHDFEEVGAVSPFRSI